LPVSMSKRRWRWRLYPPGTNSQTAVVTLTPSCPAHNQEATLPLSPRLGQMMLQATAPPTDKQHATQTTVYIDTYTGTCKHSTVPTSASASASASVFSVNMKLQMT